MGLTGRTASDYLKMLRALLPPGAAWNRRDGSELSKLLLGLAQEFGRFDSRLADFLEEVDPSTAYELLGEWERLVGIPNDCESLSVDLETRRKAVVKKLRATGGASPGYFIRLAAAAGFTLSGDSGTLTVGSKYYILSGTINGKADGVTFQATADDAADFTTATQKVATVWIDDAFPHRFGKHLFGEPMYGTTVPLLFGTGVFGDPYISWGWEHVWIVNAPADAIQAFTFGNNTFGEPYRTWATDALMCLFRLLKPAGTYVVLQFA